MKSDEFLTILTPTFNRATYLTHLYKSILEADDNDKVLWLIIDDGSNDETKLVVKKFKEENKIEVKYVYKENGGKHTAINIGLQYISTPLVMIVDSDDIITKNAVTFIEKIHQKYKTNSSISGYTFLRCTSNGKIIAPIEEDEFIANYITYRIKGNRPGDMAEVFRTNVLKQYPFTVFDNENFLSEDTNWIKIALKYDEVFVKIPIYICDYLDGGLTSTDKKAKFFSPKGSMLRGKMLMIKKCGLKNNLKGAIIYDCYKRLVIDQNDNRINLTSFYEYLLCSLMRPLGFFFYFKWRKEV